MLNSVTRAFVTAGALVLGVAAAALSANVASAQIKEAKDVKIIFVTHGQANDVYWSVVKNGVETAQKVMGSQVEYHAPETFDMVAMARLIDAAVASKPDAIVVTIPDITALKDPIMNAKAAGIPVGVVDTGIDQVKDWGLDLWVGGGSEYNNGVRAGEIMGEAGVKSAVCVNQEVGNVALDDRCNGFKDGLAKSGGKIEVVAVTMDPTKSAGRVEAFITAHPETDGVLALGPSVADPILQRLRDAGIDRQHQDGHVRPLAGGARSGRRRRDALRHRQPAIPDGLPSGRLLHHEGDVRDVSDRQRHDWSGLHHEGPGRQRPGAEQAGYPLAFRIGVGQWRPAQA